MGITEDIVNYPPKEVYDPSLLSKRNFELIILWMLNNNEECQWSDFTEDPIKISQSTLSIYLDRLKSKAYVDNYSRGYYRITSKGRNRFNELTMAKSSKKKLRVPPRIIRNQRNYDHWILWMLYNNAYCKWSDFTEEPLKINQSALSKNLNLLKDSGFVEQNENKQYLITPTGKSEYSRILKFYDLDRQSILEEEGKRIEEITRKTIKFFEKFNIEDNDIKFRFLNNVLKLSYERVKDLLNEEDFDKILLFLSINHPNVYPDYISPREFSEKYNIKETALNFFIEKIVNENFYPIKFFKLPVDHGNLYYFQANEKLEKVLSAITEDHITKFTYLNKLYEKTSNGILLLDLHSTLNAILNEICDNLFKDGLKESLRKFLPEYVKYLAYKIETERELVDTLDKLEGIAWRNIPEVFQSISPPLKIIEQHQETYHIDASILKVLSLFASPKIEKIYEEAKSLMKKKKHDEALEKVNSAIESEPENLDLSFLKAIILALLIRHQEAIEFLNKDLKSSIEDKDENSIIAYHFILIFCHLTFGRHAKALELSDKLSQNYPDHPISYAAKALILGQKIIYDLDLEEIRSDQVLDEIDQAISLDPNKSNQAKYYLFKSLVLKQLDRIDDAIEAINTAIELDPKDLNLLHYRYKIFFSKDDFDQAIELIDEKLKAFPEKDIDLLVLKAYLLKKMKKFDEGFKIVKDLREKYPKDLDILNNLLYFHLYNQEKEEAIKAGKLLTELDPSDGNFHDSFAEILTEFGEYEEALKEAQKALEVEPYGWFTYNTYLQMAKSYKATNKFDLARESLEKGERATHTCFCDIKMRKEWNEKKIKLLAEMSELEGKS